MYNFAWSHTWRKVYNYSRLVIFDGVSFYTEAVLYNLKTMWDAIS